PVGDEAWIDEAISRELSGREVLLEQSVITEVQFVRVVRVTVVELREIHPDIEVLMIHAPGVTGVGEIVINRPAGKSIAKRIVRVSARRGCLNKQPVRHRGPGD